MRRKKEREEKQVRKVKSCRMLDMGREEKWGEKCVRNKAHPCVKFW